MALPVPPPPGDRPGPRNRREQRLADEDAIAALAGHAEAANMRSLRGGRRFFARVNGKFSATSSLALYSWELGAAGPAGTFHRDSARYQGGPDQGALPAWEVTGNTRVPLDGTAVVELTESEGGLYYHFFWPAGRVPARLDSFTGGAGSGAGQVYTAIEQLAEPGGHWIDLPAARVFDPVYETNDRFADLGTIVWLERGHGAPPDVVVTITTHGDGAAVHPVESVYLDNATGGTWTLALPDGTGSALTTAPLAWDADASAVQVAIRALAGWGATSVTGAGTSGSPFVVTLADTFTDLPPMIGDPFQLVGTQEWFFDAETAVCLDLQTKVEHELRCDYPDLNLYERTLNYNCGDLQFPLPEWELVATVGCCSCEGSIGSHGSLGSVGSVGSTGGTYWCVVPYCCDSWSLMLSGITDMDGCTCSGLNTAITLAPDPLENNKNIFPRYCQYLWTLSGLPGCPNTWVKVYLVSDADGINFTLTIRCFVQPNPEGNGVQVTYTASRSPLTDCTTPLTFTKQTYFSGVEFPVCNLAFMPDTIIVTPNGNAGGANGCLPGCYHTDQLHPELGVRAIGRVVRYPGGIGPITGPEACIGVIVAGPFATAACGGVCGGGSIGSGPRYWCVRPDGSTGGSTGGGSIGSAGGGVEFAPRMTTGMAVGLADPDGCAVSCQLETDLMGTIAIGEAVTWDGGACSGTITAGPFGEPNCGGACGGSQGSIPGACCEPLPDTLHVTFGGMLSDYGSIPVYRVAPGLSQWGSRGEQSGACGNLYPVIVECQHDGTFRVEGTLYDRYGRPYAYFVATASPTSCSPFDVIFHGTPDGDDPPGTVFYGGGGDPICELSDYTAGLSE